MHSPHIHVDPIIDMPKGFPREMIVKCDLLRFRLDDQAPAVAQATFPGSAPFGQLLVALMVRDGLLAVLRPDVQHENAIRESTHTWIPEVRRREGLPAIAAAPRRLGWTA